MPTFSPVTIFSLSIAAAFVPIFCYILFLRWLDRYEREPFKHLLGTFMLGATISIFLSYIGNNFIATLSNLFLTQSGSEFFLTGLVAPFIEETNKGLIVLFFAALSREFDNVTDGLIYGAVVGLGFAMTENVLYFTRIFNEGGIFVWIQNLYLRSFFTAGVHACGAAIFGASIAYARFSKWSEKVAMGLMGLGLAIMVHSFWNSVLTVAEISNDPVLAKLPYYCLPFLFLLLFILFQFALSREAHLIEVELSHEVDTGLIPAAHLAYLKSYFARNRDGWLDEKIPKEEYIHLAVDLAFRKYQYWRRPAGNKTFYEKEIEDLRSRIKALLTLK